MDEKNKNTSGAEVNGTQTLSFDEILKDKGYQSEFDSRVSKALTTAKANWMSEMDAKNKADMATEIEARSKADKEEYAKDLAGKEAEWNKRLVRAEATGAIAKYRAKDPADILPLLDMTKVTLKEDKLEGLEDQLKALKESKAYLFQDEVKNSTGIEHSGTPLDTSSSEEAAIKRVMGIK